MNVKLWNLIKTMRERSFVKFPFQNTFKGFRAYTSFKLLEFKHNDVTFSTILERSKEFWHTKLYKLARLLLTPDEFEIENSLMNERFSLFQLLIDNGPFPLIIFEYNKLCWNVRNNNEGSFTTSSSNFYYLVCYIGGRSKIYENTTLKWLADQTPHFLSFFFFFQSFFPLL